MRNGLTLIEVIIGVLILGMIALLLANVLIGTIDLLVENKNLKKYSQMPK